LTDKQNTLRHYFQEFRRRKVFRVAAVYLVGAWLLLQVADATFAPLNLPAWSTTLVLWLLILGFPVAVGLAWTLEVTPQGVQRTRPRPKPPAYKSAGRGGKQPSIAVLPFLDMSPEKDQDHFCEGMAEELINALTKIDGVQVASRTASFQFKGASTDIDEVGERLHVTTVLEGSVRKSANQLRVTAQLINVGDGYHIWSEGYDRELKDVFGIQKEIAESVARAFKLSLTPKEERAIEQRPTENIEAYEYYLRGRRHFYQLNREGWELAREMYSRAIELDPDYAIAYAGLADCFSFLYMYADSSASNRLQAETNSRLALQLAPDLAQAHASRGLALSHSKRHEEAEQAFLRAAELDPKLFDAYYFHGRDAFVQGKFEKAAKLFERAAEVRPDDYQALALLAQVYRAMGREQERTSAQARTLDAIERRLKTTPDDARALCFGSMNLWESGQRDKAQRWVERALAAQPEDALNHYNVACAFANMGEIDKAIDCLERSIQKGMAQMDWITHDSDLDPLRGDPRFKALLPG
jgi:TolB-like protein/tetratricopeptide (TPR) repeat protein